jgi:subtilisin family serine protease
MGLRIRAALVSLVVVCAAILMAGVGPTLARGDLPSAPGHDFVDGRIVVGFQPGTSSNVADAIITLHGGRPDKVIGQGAHVATVGLGTVGATIAGLKQDPRVRYAEPDFVYHLTDLPNDPSFGQEWGLQNTGQSVNGTAGTAGADVHAPAAWSLTKGSASVAVAVVDTGIDYNHNDLAANVWSNPGGVGGCAAGTHGYNAIAATCYPLDDNDHGTHTSGTIGAVGNNNKGVTGVNWTTSLIGVKTFTAAGSATETGIIAGLQWILDAKAAGVNIRAINASWGGSDFSQATLDMIQALGAQDILFVAAAGNNGLPHWYLPFYPCDYNVDTIICVGASDQSDNLAYFSDWGTGQVDLAAPGTNILSTVRNQKYAYLSGTSMATPHVTGAAALLLSRGNRSAAEVKAAILGGVDVLPSLNGLVGTSGRLDLQKMLVLADAPGAPALSATPGDTTVDLAWTAPDPGTSPISAYRLYRGTTSGGESLVAEFGDVQTYQDTGLTDGTTYYYAVAAVNATGEGLRSNEVAARPMPPPSVPDAPVLGGAAGDGQAVLCWSPPFDGGAQISGYRLYRTTGGVEVGSDVGAVTSYTDSGAANGSTYDYQVTALNSLGEGSRSDVVSLTPPGTPPTVTGFSPTLAVGGSSISISGTGLSGTGCGTSVTFGTQAGGVSSADGTTLVATSPSKGGSGPITVSTASGSATTGADFYAVPSGSTASEVAYTGRMAIGASKAVSLPTAGTMGLVLFDGTAGQRVSLNVSAVTISQSDVSVLKPDGTNLIAATYVTTTGKFLDATTLPVAGTYTIVLNPRSTYTGGATLNLYNVPPDASATITPGGASASLTIGTPGQNGKLTFAGTAGQRVSLYVSGSIARSDIAVLNPDGTNLVPSTYMGTSTLFFDTRTLAQSGTYTIVLSPRSAYTGGATFTLYNVPPDASATITPGGASASLTIGTPGQNGKLTFPGTAGQRVSLNVSGVTISSSDVSILKPDGTTLVAATNVTTSGKYFDTTTLPLAGTYSIVVNPRTTSTGGATGSLYDVPADATGSLTPGGASASLTIGTPGQNGKLTFTAGASTAYSLVVNAVTIGQSDISVLKPDGTTLKAATYVTTTGKTIAFTTTVSGTYSIVVNPRTTYTGSATFKL